MPDFHLRAASEADIPAITDIYTEQVLHGTATYELTPPSEAEMLGRFRGLQGNRYPYLVAEEAGAILGYAYAGPFRARPAYNWFVEDSIYLAKEARGKGVGSALLERLVADCQALGFRQMLAVIGGSDNHGSIRLHEKAGFAHVGTMKGSGLKFGRWVDTVLMQKAMGEGGETIPEAGEFPGNIGR